jgi:aspartate racemase
MHRVADDVQAAISIPLLHIADAAVAAIRAAGCRTAVLLGTRYTMEQPFYVGHLARHGIECRIPDQDERAEVHRVIFDELCKGDFNAGSRRRLIRIIERQIGGGAEGVVLGCTELSLTLSPEDIGVPLFDTTALHALAAVDFALAPTLAIAATAEYPVNGTRISSAGPAPIPQQEDKRCKPAASSSRSFRSRALRCS